MQYFAPFLSVSLHRMAEAFNTDVESMQREVGMGRDPIFGERMTLFGPEFFSVCLLHFFCTIYVMYIIIYIERYLERMCFFLI